MTRLQCPDCAATLAEYARGSIVVKHRQRLIVMTVEGVAAIQCWRCGAVLDGGRVRDMLRHMEAQHGAEKPAP